MTTFTKHLTLTAILTSSIFAFSDDYLLLNDMKPINGNKSLNLRGTKISAIRVKQIEIKELLKSKKDSIDNESIHKIDTKINQNIEQYRKSYKKHLQKIAFFKQIIYPIRAVIA